MRFVRGSFVQTGVARSLGEAFAPIYESATRISPAQGLFSFDRPLAAEVEIAFRLDEDLLPEPLDEACIQRSTSEVLIAYRAYPVPLAW